MRVIHLSEKRTIPSYPLGKPEINPVFFEKRVYQGSSGKVYPVPFIDKVYDHPKDIVYRTETLENEFVRLVMLPEIGGRIFEAALDTNRQNNKAYILKAHILKHQGKTEGATKVLTGLLAVDKLDQWATYELADLKGDFANFLKSCRNDAQTILDLAIEYIEAGRYEDAIKLLNLHHSNTIPNSVVPNPLRAWCLKMTYNRLRKTFKIINASN